jgi:hypothetical protein
VIAKKDCCRQDKTHEVTPLFSVYFRVGVGESSQVKTFTGIGNRTHGKVTTSKLCRKASIEERVLTKMSATVPSKEISPKLQKTIDKLQARIKQNPDYEVHQELKAIATRCPQKP